MGSVENVDGDFKIDRIAIIGAGAAGLAAATYVSAIELKSPRAHKFTATFQAKNDFRISKSLSNEI